MSLLNRFVSCSCTNADLPMHRADCYARQSAMLAAAQYNAPAQPAPASPPKPSAAAEIVARLEDLRLQHRNYLAYQQDRVRERDHHGAWDVAINLSEVECEMAGLEFALKAIEAEQAG